MQTDEETARLRGMNKQAVEDQKIFLYQQSQANEQLLEFNGLQKSQIDTLQSQVGDLKAAN